MTQTRDIAEGREATISRWARLKRGLRRWEFWVGVVSIALTIAIIIGIVFRWEDVPKFESYGYLGAFLISLFGGITILAPVPNTPVVFVLGAVMKPAFVPYLGPVFVGIAAGLGQTVAALVVYVMGYSAGTSVINQIYGRIQTA